MSGAAVWAALGLFVLNVAALACWVAAHRPRLVLTSGEAVPEPPAVEPTVATGPPAPREDSMPADDPLERWLEELDAGDRAETTPLEESDPESLWRVWAEAHGGNERPAAAGSGRPGDAAAGISSPFAARAMARDLT